MGRRLASLLLALCLLSGCGSLLLERTYSTAEPHSSRFWESEAAGTLRAENYQDIVNDLLLLIGQHRETATLRLYNFESDLSVGDSLEQATAEIQQETPMGAYAVEYITAFSQAQRGYYEVAVQISYRRTLEQLQSVVNATSPEALYSLLNAALADERTELAVRMGYWGKDGQEHVENAVERLRAEWELEDTPSWLVNYYPDAENPGLVEFLLDVPPEFSPDEAESGGESAEETKTETGAEDAEAGGETGPEDAPSLPDEAEAESGGLPEEGEDAENLEKLEQTA